jgi:hypothetical protein
MAIGRKCLVKILMTIYIILGRYEKMVRFGKEKNKGYI